MSKAKLSKSMEFLLARAPEKWEDTFVTAAFKLKTAHALRDRGLIKLRTHVHPKKGWYILQWRKVKKKAATTGLPMGAG